MKAEADDQAQNLLEIQAPLNATTFPKSKLNTYIYFYLISSNTLNKGSKNKFKNTNHKYSNIICG